MKLPNHWNIQDFFSLFNDKRFNSLKIRFIAERYNDYEDFLSKPMSNLLSLDLNGKKSQRTYLPVNDTEKLLEDCELNNIKIISIWDENYPPLLRNITLPPLILFVKGNLSNTKRTISIVGTRQNTLYGKLTAERFASYFANQDVIVVSGLANGIDSIAHKTMVANHGITYAIIASGIDKISTEYQNKLSNEIVQSGGAIISEYPCGVVAKPNYFPVRNRIISGISTATLVIESGVKSGTLITAKFAFEQDRAVFAIPGNISAEKSKGANDLIKNNIAQICTSPEQIMQDLGWDKLDFSENNTIEHKFENEFEKALYDLIDFEPIPIDDLIEKSNFDISQILVMLLNLEFKGYIKQLPGKLFIKV
jgi:DNA processing protein